MIADLPLPLNFQNRILGSLLSSVIVNRYKEDKESFFLKLKKLISSYPQMCLDSKLKWFYFPINVHLVGRSQWCTRPLFALETIQWILDSRTYFPWNTKNYKYPTEHKWKSAVTTFLLFFLFALKDWYNVNSVGFVSFKHLLSFILGCRKTHKWYIILTYWSLRSFHRLRELFNFYLWLLRKSTISFKRFFTGIMRCHSDPWQDLG